MAQAQRNSQRNDDNPIRAFYPELEQLIIVRMNDILPRETSARELANEQGDQIQSGPGDEADISVLDTSADYFLKLANNHQREVLELRDALDRMRRGVYGLCENCENPIAIERLRKLPAARFCIDCQSTLERNTMNLIQGGRHPTL